MKNITGPGCYQMKTPFGTYRVLVCKRGGDWMFRPPVGSWSRVDTLNDEVELTYAEPLPPAEVHEIGRALLREADRRAGLRRADLVGREYWVTVPFDLPLGSGVPFDVPVGAGLWVSIDGVDYPAICICVLGEYGSAILLQVAIVQEWPQGVHVSDQHGELYQP